MSLEEARRRALGAQGLLTPLTRGPLATIRRLGYIQIDTISVVERAHDHVLWTRVPGARAGTLDRLQRRRKIFEYWWHAAAYLPMEDFRFSLPRMRALRSGEPHWFPRQGKLMREVLKRVRGEGPLRASDFEERPKGARTWWEWKPAKRALEQLFQDGELMVRRREGFQKVYDLTERVLPEGIDTTVPSDRELGEFLVSRTIEAHGIVAEREIGYLQRRAARAAVRKVLPEMLEEGRIREVRVEGSSERYFIGNSRFSGDFSPRLSLLSPFDNAVIQRKRLQGLFGFDYRIECYVPEPKRTFGYFCLPILWGERFVGRLDPKADRKAGVLRVRSIFWEKDAPARAKAALPLALRDFAAFNGLERFLLPKSRSDGT